MSMKDKAKNMLQISKGKMKETTGGAIGNPSLEAHGVHDQKMGNLKQAGEKVKDAFKRR
ncbi:MAG TPA: CsbD family protein [Acidimicrobiales bacterium]|nr:CsbD family protein [Acidimicrobiales bacterium]